MTGLRALIVIALAALLSSGASPVPAPSAEASTEVVVALTTPPLGLAPGGADRLAAEQAEFRQALRDELPGAEIRWRYRLVLNGFAVDLAGADVARVRTLPGVREVYESARYAPALDRSPGQIGAPALWGPGLDTAGQGMKIAIIDTGVDQSHAFFDPTGYTAPAGFPKGQIKYTNAKVIVARAFPPKGVTSAAAKAAFDSDQSSHGTHVAGIAAGNPGTRAVGGRTVSGVAPRAYIGNYKALTRTEFGLSPNGNAPELVAAIEAAVADGMDVINLSIGEPEIEPARDVVALALDAAAAAGVVSVVAAGNDYTSVGAGSVSSPANSNAAIAVAAVEAESASELAHAEFSSVGPTPISLRLKPDVSAPGVSILSSVPGGWGSFSGTSMAAPHVAGAVALLEQRHPDWTVAQIKSALVQTGTDVVEERSGILAPQFQGGGMVSLTRADQPLLFATPTAVSFGLIPRGSTVRGSIRLDDAGGGAGTWQVTELRPLSSTGAGNLVLPASVEVPGELSFTLVTSRSAKQGEVSGFAVLRRGADERRIPFWGRVSVPALGRHRTVALARPGLVRGTTEGRPALVARYRYPENPSGLGLNTRLLGPELVFQLRLTRRVANFGVVITERAAGSRVEPRVVRNLDESQLTGYAALPVDHNPYLPTFREPILAAGALSPAPGRYAVVFDSPAKTSAGAFMFRYWVNDVTPPTVRIRARSVTRGAPFIMSVTDAGSGVYPDSLLVSLDGNKVDATLHRGIVRVSSARLTPGRHELRVRISDYQEAKNTENVARILPNTRTLSTTVTVRP